MLYGSEDTGEIVEIVHTGHTYSGVMEKIISGPLKEVYAAYLKNLSDNTGGDYEVLDTL
jgi:hypothetical protein